MLHPILNTKEKVKDPFLTKQLIAYIGNKRSLLGFLGTVFKELESQGERTVFSDPFAGSGAVSRLAKSMNYDVFTNDWEPYSQIVNSCHIGINRRELQNLFGEKGGIEKVFRKINNLDGSLSNPYISRHFAPENTEEADYWKERLFYTKENALFIDRARTYIEDNYPGWNHDEKGIKEKTILLSSLLYEVSTHANTSGVFKACHKGFGGHGKDALSRILAPMEMEIPQLIDREGHFKISNMDARDFVSPISSHLCYLDPPYNGHQYGSNYFMLNTVAIWDKPDVSVERKDDGRFKEKAGIRKDWVKTRSPYCYKKNAPEAFFNLLDKIDSRYILLSYNTEGIIPFEQLYGIMENQGKTELFCHDYLLYRGGKQSLVRQNYNMELLLVLDRNKSARKGDRKNVQRFLSERKLLNLLRRPFNPKKIKKNFTVNGEQIIIRNKRETMRLETKDLYLISKTSINFNFYTDDELNILFERLESSSCIDYREEVQVLIKLISQTDDSPKRNSYYKRLLQVLRKFAFKKYKSLFLKTIKELDQLIIENPKSFFPLDKPLSEIKEIAQLRFKG